MEKYIVRNKEGELLPSFHADTTLHTNVLAEALKSINRAEKRGKLQVTIRPCSKPLFGY